MSLRNMLALSLFVVSSFAFCDENNAMIDLKNICQKYVALPKYEKEASKMLEDLDKKLKNKLADAEQMDKSVSVDSAIRDMLLDWLAGNSKWLRDPDRATPEQRLKASVYVTWAAKHNVEPSDSWRKEEISIKRWVELLTIEIKPS